MVGFAQSIHKAGGQIRRARYAMGLVQTMPHRSMYTWLICCVALLGSASLSPAQLVIDTSYSPAQLVREVFMGNRVKVGNIRIRGKPGTFAYFRDSSDRPLIGEGLLFSTGIVFDAAGPNRRPDTGTNVGGKGDRELHWVSDGRTFDATGVDFDFIPQYETVVFNYIFGSEEYTEYVNSQFNDVFAFYISGPGYKGRVNLAVVPGTNTPITINTVNGWKNEDFYLDNNWFNIKGKPLPDKVDNLNDLWFKTYEMDGMTTLLQIRARVIPGEKYHIKITLCDVSDGAYDSVVMLEGKSFTSLPMDPARRDSILALEAPGFRRLFQPAMLGGDPPRGSAQLLGEGEETDPSEAPETAEEGEKEPDWRLMVNFDLDEHILNQVARRQLEDGLKQLGKYPDRKLLVEGHACDIGSSDYNLRLSLRRARAVQQYLVKAGIAEDRILVSGKSEHEPMLSNQSPGGREMNRRVEIRWK